MTPAVTILMPMRNAASTLPSCLDSVLRQSLENFELLIVDDHSTDNSAQLVRDVSQSDPRIRTVSNPAQGIVSALNFGLSEARNDIIALMDADDLMDPHRIELQYQYLIDNPAVALVACQVELFPTPTDGYMEYLRWQNLCLTPDDIRNEIFVESPFAHPAVTFRRQAVLDVGGYRDGDFPEDYELWLRMNAAGLTMSKLPQVLLRWRDTPGRLSRQDPRYRRDAFDRLRAEYLVQHECFEAAEQYAIWGAGRRTRKRCEHLLERGRQPVAWIDIDPKKIGNCLNGVPVVAPQWLEQNRVFVLGYVSNHGARDEITAWLESRHFRRGVDFLMVG